MDSISQRITDQRAIRQWELLAEGVRSWRSHFDDPGIEITVPLLRAMKDWCSTPRRRVITIGAVPMAVVVAVMLHSWFLALPWSWRKSTFQIVTPLSASLMLIWSARRGHFLPHPLSEPTSECGTSSWLGKLTACLPAGLALSLAIPLLWHFSGVGALSDWDQFLQKHEAIRKSLLTDFQFPWWNPWRRGGFPLAADPETGVLSLATGMVLIFGTSVGLRLSAIAYVMLAAEGVRRLAKIVLGDQLGATLAAVVYAMNGAAIAYLASGFFIPMSFAWLPWQLYFVLRLDAKADAGRWLGFWAALALLSGIQYPTVYGCLIVAVFWLARWFAPATNRNVYAWNTLDAVAVVLLLCSWRLVPTLLLLRDYPRTWESLVDLDLWSWLALLLNRPTGEHFYRHTDLLPWEAIAYTGPVVMALACASLARGWRWWHTLTLLCFACALGSRWWYQPSFWLKDWPLFSSMHWVHRWRIPGMLGLGLAAGSALSIFFRSPGSRRKNLVAWLLFASVAADYVACGWQWLPNAFAPPVAASFPQPPTPHFANIERWPMREQLEDGRHAQLLSFPATLNGYGVIRTHEALLGYDRNLPTARRWIGHPDYRGEACTSEGETVHPIRWSPNLIVFRTTPGRSLELNINPGSWWLVNGKRQHPDYRCAEWQRPFLVTADEQGWVRLEIAPPGMMPAAILTAIGAIILASRFIKPR